MELLEVVIQGLRGFPRMTRLALGPAVTVVHPLSGNEAAVLAVVEGLLYPDVSGTGDDPLAPFIDPAADVVRVGLLVRARDGVAYRILRDVKGTKWSLMKESAGGFSPVTNRPGDISQLVTAAIGFPQGDIFRDIFITRKADLPSQRRDALASAAPSAPEVSAPMPAVQEAGPVSEFASLSEEERRSTLQRVESALEHNANIRRIEQELDALQRELFTLDEQLGHIDGYRQAAEDAEKALQTFQHLEAVPDDFIGTVNRLTRSVDVTTRDLRRIHEERAGVEQQLQRELAARPKGALLAEAFRDKHILGGTALGLGGILLAMVGAVAFEPLRYAAFLDVPGFAIALYGAFRFLGDAEGEARLRYRLQRIDEDRDQKAAQLARDEQQLKECFERVGYPPEEIDRLEQALNQRAAARATFEEARAALDQVLADPSLAPAEARRQELKAQVQEADERLYATGGYMGDGNELRRQREELLALLEGREPDLEGIPSSGPVRRAPAAPVVEVPAAPPAGPYDPTAKLIGHARDLLLSDLDTTCQTLQPRVGQYLAGLSDRRYEQAVFGVTGEMSIVDTASGQSIPFAQLTPGDRDLAYLSLKLTIVEAAVRRGRLPLLLERALETLPETKDPLLLRMLQYLGTLTQVLTMTTKPGLASASEHRVTLS